MTLEALHEAGERWAAGVVSEQDAVMAVYGAGMVEGAVGLWAPRAAWQARLLADVGERGWDAATDVVQAEWFYRNAWRLPVSYVRGAPRRKAAQTRGWVAEEMRCQSWPRRVCRRAAEEREP